MLLIIFPCAFYGVVWYEKTSLKIKKYFINITDIVTDTIIYTDSLWIRSDIASVTFLFSFWKMCFYVEYVFIENNTKNN